MSGPAPGNSRSVPLHVMHTLVKEAVELGQPLLQLNQLLHQKSLMKILLIPLEMSW